MFCKGETVLAWNWTDYWIDTLFGSCGVFNFALSLPSGCWFEMGVAQNNIDMEEGTLEIGMGMLRQIACTICIHVKFLLIYMCTFCNIA